MAVTSTASTKGAAPVELSYALQSAQPTILEIRQYANPLIVKVLHQNGQETLVIPGHRAGCAYVYLDPANGETQSVELIPRYADTVEPLYEIRVIQAESTEPYKLFHQALVIYHQGYSSALQRALELFTNVEDLQSCEEALVNHAVFCRTFILYQLFRFDEARQQIALLSKEWWQDPEFRVITLWLIGAIALEQYETTEAHVYLEEALRSSDVAVGAAPWVLNDQVEIILYLALVEMRLRHNDKALELFGRGFATAEFLGSKILEGKLRNNYAAYFDHYRSNALADYVSNYETARSEYQKALDLLESTGEVLTRTSTLANLARLALSVGDVTTAQRRYHEALRLNRSSHNEVLRGYLYSQLGTLYLTMGDLGRAHHYINHSHKIRSDASATRMMYQDRLLLGRISKELGRPNDAVPMLESAARFYKDYGGSIGLAQCHTELAECLMMLGDDASAGEHVDLAWQDRHKVEIPSVLLRIARTKVKLLEFSGDDAGAEKIYLESLKWIRETKHTPEVIDTLFLGMRFYRRRNLGRSIELGEEALRHISSLRGQLDISRLGPSFSNKTGVVTSELAVIYLEANRPLDGVRALESGRAALLNAQRKLEPSPELSVARRKVNLLSEKRISSIDSANDEELLTAYYESLEELSSLLGSELQVVDSESHDIEAALQALPQDTVVLYYIQNAEDCWLVSVASVEVKTFKLAKVEVLAQKIELFIQAIERGEEAPVELSELLFPAPIHTELSQAGRLVIVPTGSLHALPFAALPIQFGGRRGSLSDHMPIVGVHSLKSLTSQNDQVEVNDIALFADPMFAREHGESALSDERYRSWTGTLSRLPWTAKEVEYIKTNLPSIKCHTYTGSEATRTNLMRKEVRESTILHIASHGYFSSYMPDVVGIAFTPEAESDTGFLALSDLFSAKFANSLVVISGCETGVGSYVEGEGYLSMSRGFLAEGVTTVISTLWPVSDRASALFMKAFYRSLSNNGSPMRVLSEAQRELKTNPRYKAPLYWAGYLLHTTSLSHQLKIE